MKTKRVLSLLLSVLLVFGAALPAGLWNLSASAAAPVKGDVDQDGLLTPADARLILRASVRLEDMDEERADMEGDGMCTAADARLAMRTCVFLEDYYGISSVSPIFPDSVLGTEFEGVQENLTVAERRDDGQLILTVSASDFAGTTDGILYVGYDTEKLSLSSASVKQMNRADADWEEDNARTEQNELNGVFVFAFYFKGQAAADETELFELTFDMLDGDDAGEYCLAVGEWNGMLSPDAYGDVYEVPEAPTHSNVIEYAGSRYCVFYDEADWFTAKERCEEQGGHLATIGSAEENEIIFKLCRDSIWSDIWCWLGAECYDGEITWVTGEEPVYTNWDEGQPDETDGGQHWACMWNGGYWDDDFSESCFRYVCEWDAEDCPYDADETWNPVTVYFDGNGAEGEQDPMTVMAGESFWVPSCSFDAPEGKKFCGWELDGERYPEWSSVIVEEDAVCTAVWGDYCTLNPVVSENTAENTVTVTLRAENFAGTTWGDIEFFYNPDMLEYVSAVSYQRPDYFSAVNHIEGENRIAFGFFFGSAAEDDEFDLITMRFRRLDGDNGSVYYRVNNWGGGENADDGWLGRSSGYLLGGIPTPPENVSVKATDANTLTVTWDAVPYATQYNVYHYDSAAKKYRYTGTTHASAEQPTQFVDTGLTVGDVRTYHVVAVNKANDVTLVSDPSASAKATVLGTPAVPTNVTAKPTGDGVVTVSWSKAKGATQYNVYRYNGAKKTYVYLGTTKDTSYEVTGLTGGTAYYFKVVAAAKGNGLAFASEKSASASVTALATPAVPTNVTAKPTAEGTVTVSWSKAKGATQYNVYRYNGTKKTYVYLGTTQDTSYEVAGLTGGTAYYFKVVAVAKGSGLTFASEKSASVTVTALATPAVPTNVTAKPTAEGTVTVSWSKAKGATQYNVYRYNGTKKTYVYLGTTQDASYEVAGLTGGTAYYFKVVAVAKGSGLTFASEKSASVSVTALATPAVPTNVKAKATADRTITVSWSKVKGATQYNVYRYNGAKKAYVYLGTSKTTSFDATGLSNGTTYYFKVAAVAKGSGLTFVSEKSASATAKAMNV